MATTSATRRRRRGKAPERDDGGERPLRQRRRALALAVEEGGELLENHCAARWAWSAAHEHMFASTSRGAAASTS